MNHGFESRELDVAVIHVSADLIEQHQLVLARAANDVEATRERPRILPAWRRAHDRMMPIASLWASRLRWYGVGSS